MKADSENLTSDLMKRALEHLDTKLTHPVRLIMGGGGALLLAHHLSLSTADIDAIPATGTTIEELDPLIKIVASELKISPDWLNPYFSTFTHVLPSDYSERLIRVFQFSSLIVDALSKEDLLLMKCFAGRLKDKNHARALIKAGAKTSIVETQLEYLVQKKIPGAGEAIDFLDEVLDTLA